MKTARKEGQAETRTSLLQSAARLFCKRGMEGTSVGEISADAGYTKGAFYANFKSKEELFLAMLDDRFSQRIEEAERAFADSEGSPPQQARTAATDFARAKSDDPELVRLFAEFSTYALRDEAFREELLTRFATLRARLQEIFQRRADASGLTLDIPIERVVLMTIAMADGWALWRLLDPDAVDEELLAEMMELFTIGVGVRGGVLEQPHQPA